MNLWPFNRVKNHEPSLDTQFAREADAINKHGLAMESTEEVHRHFHITNCFIKKPEAAIRMAIKLESKVLKLENEMHKLRVDTDINTDVIRDLESQLNDLRKSQ